MSKITEKSLDRKNKSVLMPKKINKDPISQHW